MKYSYIFLIVLSALFVFSCGGETTDGLNGSRVNVIGTGGTNQPKCVDVKLAIGNEVEDNDGNAADAKLFTGTEERNADDELICTIYIGNLHGNADINSGVYKDFTFSVEDNSPDWVVTDISFIAVERDGIIDSEVPDVTVSKSLASIVEEGEKDREFGSFCWIPNVSGCTFSISEEDVDSDFDFESIGIAFDEDNRPENCPEGALYVDGMKADFDFLFEVSCTVGEESYKGYATHSVKAGEYKTLGVKPEMVREDGTLTTVTGTSQFWFYANRTFINFEGEIATTLGDDSIPITDIENVTIEITDCDDIIFIDSDNPLMLVVEESFFDTITEAVYGCKAVFTYGDQTLTLDVDLAISPNNL